MGWIHEKQRDFEDLVDRLRSKWLAFTCNDGWAQSVRVVSRFPVSLSLGGASLRRSADAKEADWEAEQVAHLQPWLKDPHYIDDRPQVTVQMR